MFGEVKPQRMNNPTGNTGERERERVSAGVPVSQYVQIDMDGWMDGFELYHFIIYGVVIGPTPSTQENNTAKKNTTTSLKIAFCN